MSAKTFLPSVVLCLEYQSGGGSGGFYTVTKVGKNLEAVIG